MSLKKQFLKSKPVCKVTFTLPKEEVLEAEKVILLGEFNNWEVSNGIELQKLKNGSFKVVVDLPLGNEYQYKFLIDGLIWKNDPEADKYTHSGIGEEQNSVVVL